MLIKLAFKPGIVRNMTAYSNTGGWYDCDWMRFRMGLPEMMGGWAKQITDQFLGICRSLFGWSLIGGALYYALGTSQKYYVSNTSEYTDVTPIRRTVTLGAAPFSVTSGVTTMTVTDVFNEAGVGDYVTFSGATAFANLVAGDLNQEFAIVSLVDADHYTVTLGVTPNATTTGGGAAVSAAYQISVGPDSATTGTGWGTGTWGRGTWGSDADGVTIQLRIWTQDNFGEDLIANVVDGGIYHWDATQPDNRMIALEDLPGANEAPLMASAVLVSPEEQHTIAFGCNPLGETEQDPMLVRWSDTESYLEWEPTETNTAGGYRLSLGTKIVSVEHTKGQILIWTDRALYTMTWTGVPYVFNFQLAGDGLSIVGPNARVSVNDTVYWMAENEFYAYDGRIRLLQCPVTDYVFTNINIDQIEKVYCYVNTQFNEVGWLYPAGDECDSYVIYNFKDEAWYFGTIDRTAWLDQTGSYYPLATSSDSYLYAHEFGFNDGSTNPAQAIPAFIESSPIEAGDEGSGEHFMFVDRLIPDLTFRNSTAAAPAVTMTMKTQDYPGQAVAQSNASTVQTTSALITQFTTQCFIRLRGRSLICRYESNATDVTWRLGIPRISYRLDGRR